MKHFLGCALAISFVALIVVAYNNDKAKRNEARYHTPEPSTLALIGAGRAGLAYQEAPSTFLPVNPLDNVRLEYSQNLLNRSLSAGFAAAQHPSPTSELEAIRAEQEYQLHEINNTQRQILDTLQRQQR
jgi:hypothetical protein